jgi:hypothetical protein
MAFFSQLSSNTPTAHERILKVNFVNHTAQFNLISRKSDGLVISRRAGNIEKLALARYR